MDEVWTGDEGGVRHLFKGSEFQGNTLKVVVMLELEPQIVIKGGFSMASLSDVTYEDAYGVKRKG